MARLSGRTAIVTGGAKGIGRHYSLALAAEGARVMIADISDGTELAQEIAAKHGANSVTSAIADVSDESSVKSLVAAAMERFGRIDVLVNNAALFAPLQETKCTEIDADLWDKVMAVNLRGPFLMVKHVAPHMIARGYGKVINIGSGTAYRGIPWMLHYVTSKGGIMAFTRALARELGENGIRVNTLAPGFTLSDEREPGPCADRPRPGRPVPLAAARPASAGPAGRAGLPRLGGQRFHHRPDPRGGRRQCEHLRRPPAAPKNPRIPGLPKGDSFIIY
jgi:NAD(P)-dependent dehydrogenase (short-subunit alcohol dehydrogenase family)